MKILLIGYGTMNQRVARLAEEKGHEIIGTIEPEEHQHSPYKTYHHIADAQNEADVAIDFSNPNLLLPLLDEGNNRLGLEKSIATSASLILIYYYLY